MKKLLLPLLALSLIVGCESTPHYDRTKVVTTAAPLPKKPYGTVKFYQSKQEVPGRYDVIALLSVEGKAGEEAAFIKAFLYRAADLGADAIIFYRAGLTSGTEGDGWGHWHATQEGSYRAEAIHFTSQEAATDPVRAKLDALRKAIEWADANQYGASVGEGSQQVYLTPDKILAGEKQLLKNLNLWIAWCDQHPTGGTFTDDDGKTINVVAEMVGPTRAELQKHRQHLEAKFDGSTSR